MVNDILWRVLTYFSLLKLADENIWTEFSPWRLPKSFVIIITRKTRSSERKTSDRTLQWISITRVLQSYFEHIL
mgnify:CR=1 FL=1